MRFFLRHSWISTLPQALSHEALLQAEPQDAQSDQYSKLPQFYPSACEQDRHELEGNLSFINLQSYSWTNLLQCISISLLNNGQLQMQLINHCWVREVHEKVFAAPGDFRGGLGSWRPELFRLTCHSVGNLLVYINWSIKANSHVDGIRGPGIHIYFMAHSFLTLSAPWEVYSCKVGVCYKACDPDFWHLYIDSKLWTAKFSKA